jgi:hypothetical protein
MRGMRVWFVLVGVVAALWLPGSRAQAETSSWVFGLGNSLSEQVHAAALGRHGEVVITGAFRGTVDFDPGPGVVTLTSTGGSSAFIAKYSQDGALIWARGLFGEDDAEGRDVVVDATGYIGVVGNFKNAVDMDPGPSVVQATSEGAEDVFLLRLDPDGNYDWHWKGGDSSSDSAEGVAVGPGNHLYITGGFEGDMSFDPSPSKIVISSNGDDDAFVARFTSYGLVLWARGWGDSGDDSGYAVGVDAQGRVFTVGGFEGRDVDLDPTWTGSEFSSAGKEDVFLTVLQPDASWRWSTRFGGPGEDRVTDLVVTPEGAFYMTGRFANTADFDHLGAGGVITSKGESDIFLVKYNGVQAFAWAHGFGGAQSDQGAALSRDLLGNVTFLASFEQTVDFDPGPGVSTLTSTVEDDLAVAQYTADGSLRRAQLLAGPADEQPGGVAVDEYGAVIVTGAFQTTLDLGGGLDVSGFTGPTYDVFLAKLPAADWSPGLQKTYAGIVTREYSVAQ